jgi:mRNA interferase RelE/StbE
MYAIDWAPRARRQLGKVRDREQRLRILRAVGRLAGFPAVAGLEALKEHRYGFRLRIGGYRALIDVDTKPRIVLVQEIRRRDERTY